jgi:hypothetical protein
MPGGSNVPVDAAAAGGLPDSPRAAPSAFLKRFSAPGYWPCLGALTAVFRRMRVRACPLCVLPPSRCAAWNGPDAVRLRAKPAAGRFMQRAVPVHRSLRPAVRAQRRTAAGPGVPSAQLRCFERQTMKESAHRFHTGGQSRDEADSTHNLYCDPRPGSPDSVRAGSESAGWRRRYC